MTDRYRTRSDDTWDRARDAYLAGETAESVCSRFDLGLRTFYDRARAGGWRRADQPDPKPFEIEEDAALDDIVSDAELRLIARTRMALAARRGLVGEALRWARLTEMIDRQAQAEARLQRDLAREEAREQALADRQQNQRTKTSCATSPPSPARSRPPPARPSPPTAPRTFCTNCTICTLFRTPLPPTAPTAENRPENDDDAPFLLPLREKVSRGA